ncbi:MAG: hypothetical protein APR53_02355 [Methanoculleus sp. SDB]|nr:MAG: hypothetical protein APR53_02355 [Methanoculleus sp. SDB]
MPFSHRLACDIPVSLTRHVDVIGDVAVVALPPGTEKYGESVVAAIRARRPHIHTVLAKISRVTGERRIARYEVLAGGDTRTIHREYGFMYRLDVGSVFFTPRLASERQRVTSQVVPGERVLVPFAGAGPFVIPAAFRGADVVAIEKNADACRYLRENTRLNGVEGAVSVLRADVRDCIAILGKNPPFDRAIVPTPYGWDESPVSIAPLIRAEGMLHFYTFAPRRDVASACENLCRAGFSVVSCRRCGHVAPGVSRWVFDLSVPPLSRLSSGRAEVISPVHRPYMQESV